VKLQRLLLDNVATIGDLDHPLTGKRLLLCGIQSRERASDPGRGSCWVGAAGLD
jgi:hypothetical protein